MIDTIITILGTVTILCIGGLGVCQFLKFGRAKQIEIILEWLLLAVTKAEKEFGDGTGQLKLRYVYDLFIDKFKFAAMLISFNQFSELVDQALDTMKDMINSNDKIKDYVNK